MQKLLLTFC